MRSHKIPEGQRKQEGGGTEMLNIGWEGEGGSGWTPKKNCDLAQTGAIFRQEGSRKHVRQFYCSSECVVVIQVDFLNGIHPFPSAKSLRYYDKKSCGKKKI